MMADAGDGQRGRGGLAQSTRIGMGFQIGRTMASSDISLYYNEAVGL